MVRISMDCFVKRYQPDKYEQWKAGLDLAPHPEDEYVRAYGPRARGKIIGLQEYDDPDLSSAGHKMLLLDNYGDLLRRLQYQSSAIN